jgi:uncharacterized BrkB/YihY/UPF0761 family membrane protein
VTSTVPDPVEPVPEDGDDAEAQGRVAKVRRRAVELRAEAEARFEVERERRTWVQLAYQAWDMDRQRGGPLLAGGLAYRLFLWLLPFALLLTSVVRIVADVGEGSPDDVARTVGFSGAVVRMVGQAAADTGSSAWWLALAGGVLSLWAARGLARALMVTARIAWAMPPSAGRAGVKAALAVWGFFVAGLAAQWLRPLLFRGGVGSDLLAQAILFVVTLALFTFGMALGPHRGSWASVLPGAALSTVGLRGMAIATAVYFADQLTDTDLYGAMGIATVILLYLFICSRLYVWGQFLNARIGGVRLTVDAQTGDAATPG